jgi:hypothetical protein
MTTTWGARATSAVSGIDANFLAHAASLTGGRASITTGGIIVADGFAAQRNVEQFCARVHLKFPGLNFEILRPPTRKKKKGPPTRKKKKGSP